MAHPKLVWGPAFDRTLALGQALDHPLAWREPNGERELTQALVGTGNRAVWHLGHTSYMTAALRLIPLADEDGLTGWDGATGVRAWLADARRLNPFRFYPDGAEATWYTCLLEEPKGGGAQHEINGAKRLDIRFRVLDRLGVTSTPDPLVSEL